MTRIWPGEWLRQIAQRPIVPVRSEVVQILRLTLPPLAAGQRKAAALFAAEPLIAQPLEEVQVSLGPRLPDDGGPSSWLAVVIARETLARMIAENTRSGARFVPDALFLPRPAVGQWTVALREGRLLARLPDGTGFAAPEAAFRAIWAQAGQPTILWVHGSAPAGLPVTHQALAAFPVAPDPALSGFDLAEGQTQDWRRPGRIAALLAVLVLGLAAHFAVLGVKVHRARLAADATETQLRDALVKRGVKVGTSVDAAATAAIQAASGTPSAGFLAQLSRVMQVISTKAGVVTLQDLSYDNRSLRLTMTLLAPELGSLQDTANLLNAAGLKADLGASTIADGTARATIAITGGAG